ncbi:MAG: reactive intermediate/imine deaminase [Rhodospirillaceae bacterium]|nr:reactive intermediate/imine deaminase [Rhodospirillaceae bacterium]
MLISINIHAQDSRTYINGRTAADTDVPPYSGAVLVGNTLYLSGALGIDENSEIPEDPADEARNALNTIKLNLEAIGMTMDDLVSVQVFCSDVSHYQAFNDVYRTFFTQEYPARAFIGSGTLLFDARFEVQGIAIKR